MAVFRDVTVRACLALAASACVLSSCAGDSEGDEPVDGWTHDPAAETGPARWGSVDERYTRCVDGSRQSPIDLGAAVPGDLPPLELDYAAVPLAVENTGHTVEVEMPAGSASTLTVGDDVYRLVQYHFHTPSEHTIGGRHHDLEAHLVHEGEGGRLAVVAVFLTRSRPPSPLVSAILERAPDGAGETSEGGEEASAAGVLQPGAAGPLTIARYTTYAGSLTTPDCSEGVRWLVVTETAGVAGEALERLRELVAGFPGYDEFARNNRPVQPLNGRTVTRDER